MTIQTNIPTSTLMQANAQWANRPADQRYQTLEALTAAVKARRIRSRAQDAETSLLKIEGSDDGTISINGQHSQAVPTNWGFGQLSRTLGAPAGYLRTLPAPLAAKCLMQGVHDTEKQAVKVLTLTPDDDQGDNAPRILQAVTSPTYGRIWDADVCDMAQRIVERSEGRFHNPMAYTHNGAGLGGITGQAPSGLYASDRDCFIFMIDGGSLLEAGPRAKLHRGFFLWNSEVGSASFGLMTFLFNCVCGNNIVWGAQEVNKLVIRHSAGGPARFDGEAMPALMSYANAASQPLIDGIQHAQTVVLPREAGKPAPTIDNVLEFTAKAAKFTRTECREAIEYALREEGQCVTAWDLVQGFTASAREIQFVDARIDLERRAGKVLSLVSTAAA
jgi:hypothetical protein